MRRHLRTVAGSACWRQGSHSGNRLRLWRRKSWWSQSRRAGRSTGAGWECCCEIVHRASVADSVRARLRIDHAASADAASIEPSLRRKRSVASRSPHEHGEQKHRRGWLKELVDTRPRSSFDDARHGPNGRSSRRARRRPTRRSSSSARRSAAEPTQLRPASSVHIPIVEEFVHRIATKMDSGEGALPSEVINRIASAHFTGGIPNRREQRRRCRRPPTSACSVSRAFT